MWWILHLVSYWRKLIVYYDVLNVLFLCLSRTIQLSNACRTNSHKASSREDPWFWLSEMEEKIFIWDTESKAFLTLKNKQTLDNVWTTVVGTSFESLIGYPLGWKSKTWWWIDGGQQVVGLKECKYPQGCDTFRNLGDEQKKGTGSMVKMRCAGTTDLEIGVTFDIS